MLSTPRTGSSLFCQALERNGLGWPMEWFNELYLRSAIELLGGSGLNVGAYVQKVILGSANPATKVFGVKFHVAQYLFLKQQGYDLFDIGFDRGYYVYRRNKLKQAYSLAKSRRTGFWSREAEIAGGHTERVEAEVTPLEFAQCLAEVMNECAFADAELRGRTARAYALEDLVRGELPGAVAGAIADLGLPAGEIDASLPTARQSSSSDDARLAALLQALGGSVPTA